MLIIWTNDSSTHTLKYFSHLCPIQYYCHYDDWPTCHSILFQIFSRLGVVSKDDRFCFALFDHFQRLLVPRYILFTFHNKLEPRLDPLQQLFCPLCSHYLPALGVARPPTISHQNGQGARKAGVHISFKINVIFFG